MAEFQLKKVALLVSGGPAPGINSVIRAATIKLRNNGVEVVGIFDGFKWLMTGDTNHVMYLDIPDVSQIHFEGGSILRTTRANPTKKPEDIRQVVESLEKLGVDALLTIGGDDTCFAASLLEEDSHEQLHVIHIPKTIDNDLDLPMGIRTFGFSTARALGVELTKNVIEDARTTGRWYFLVAMGRKAGHLALGIGKSAGATLTIIPEEFPEKTISLPTIVDILVGAVIKRLVSNRPYGTAVIAEGISEKLEAEELERMGHIERDEYGHLRLAEIDLGKILKNEVRTQLKEIGIDMTIVDKNIGYELRCMEPNSYDLEYTTDLGYSAAKHALNGGTGDIVAIQNGRFIPIPFDQIMDPKTGRTKVRMIDVNTESYEVAYEYMVRLKLRDLDDPQALKKLADVANMLPDQFRNRFEKSTMC